MISKPERYTIANLKRACENPGLIEEEFSYLSQLARHRLHTVLTEQLFEAKYGPGIEVTERDWDNLIVLDACRYDVFESVNWIDGTLERVVSQASHSSEFIDANFNGKELHDSVYISANPHADKTLEEGVFHRVIRTYNQSGAELETPELEYETLHPEYIYRTAMDHIGNFSNKRLIIHFMTPHAPYFGDKADRLRDELYEKNVGFYSRKHEGDVEDAEDVFSDLLGAAQQGYISDSDLYECYVDNMAFVLDYVEALVNELDGKTVITGDHGELLGNPSATLSPKYKHPRNVYTPELRTVPWLEIDSGERKTVVPEEPIPADEMSAESVEKQLQALGYTD